MVQPRRKKHVVSEAKQLFLKSHPKPRRPKSSYLHYMDWCRPKLPSNLIGGPAKIREIARRWALESPGRVQQFKDKAAPDQLRYRNEMKIWQSHHQPFKTQSGHTQLMAKVNPVDPPTAIQEQGVSSRSTISSPDIVDDMVFRNFLKIQSTAIREANLPRQISESNVFAIAKKMWSSLNELERNKFEKKETCLRINTFPINYNNF